MAIPPTNEFIGFLAKKTRELLRVLKQNGWIHIKTKGSHYHLEKEGKKIILPFHGNKEVAKGTEQAILKQANLK